MGSTCIDAILHNLEFLEKNLEKKNDELGMLELELRLMRTFLLCSRNCNKDVCLESHDNKHASLRSSLFGLEDALQKMQQRLDEGSSSSDLKEVVPEFREIINSFKEEIKELYSALLDCPVHSSSPVRDELMEVIDSLLENLEDLKSSKPYDQAFYMVRAYDKVLREFIEALEVKLAMFGNFIGYITWRGVRHGLLEGLLTHVIVMAVNAALATYVCWFDRNDKMFLIFVQLQEISPNDPRIKDENKLISELLQKIKADDNEVLTTFIQVLKASTLSGSPHTLLLERDMHILGHFLESLLVNLFELLNYPSSVSIYLNNELQVLYTGLRFLRTILKKQQEKLNDLDENIKDLVQLVVNDAGIVIFSLSVSKIKSVLAKEVVLAFFDLLKKVKFLKTEVENKYPVTSTSNSSRINEVGFTYNSKNDFEGENDAKNLSHVPPQGNIQTINEVIVGLDDEAEAIINQLTRGSMQLDKVSIVGMPGLGKTTLAKKVYNDRRITCHFHVQAWCHVSQVYCKKNLLLEILECIVQKAQNSEKDEDDLALELYRCLKKSRYLIVLDDVWDIEAWNDFKGSFPDDASGSRILLTSRLHKVAEQVGKLHPLRRLTDDESWELLQKKLFCKADFLPALIVLGKQIAKNCSGLPLIIVIIAGILSSINQDGWEEVATRLNSNTVCGTKECMDVLDLSYRHLPDYLKPCFLYLGAYSEVREIPLWKLTCLWIAEGFVQKAESRSLEEVAEAYMMELIDRSLVMIAKKRSLSGVKTCSIHDLLLEFCVAKAKEEYFLEVLHGSEELFTFNEPGNIHRLCIHSKVKDFLMSRLFCPRISCLLFFAHGNMPQMCNISFIFRIYKLLRVLDLEQIDIGNTFPIEIEFLVELRYLAIYGDIESIPLSVANLSNLETFHVKTYGLQALLPATIWNMKKLRHLVGLGKVEDFSLAEDNLESSPSLYNLDTFSTLTLSASPTTEKIMRKFPNIRKLKCRLSGESIGESNRIVVMDFLSQLESLKLFLGHYHIDFQFPVNLKKLTLEYFPWSIISTIGNIPNLEVLKLHSPVFEEEIWDMKEGEFPKLRILKLVHLKMVTWSCSGECDHLPNLEKLVLQKCWKLEEVPSCLGYSNLETIEVRWCSASTTSLIREVEKEQRSLGNENLKILILGDHNTSS